MADLSKIKGAKSKTNRFGDVPLPAEKSATLEEPEHAPKAKDKPERKKARAKTGRTVPFSTKVTSEFDEDFRRTAFENGLKHAELMEAGLAAYKKIN